MNGTEPGVVDEVEQSEGERAFAEALAIVARREYSEAELGDRLRRQGYDEAVAAAAVGRCVEAGYVDDLRYARLRAERRLERRPAGRRDLVRDLRRRGLDPTMSERVADEVLAAAGGETAVLQRALRSWCDRHGEPCEWRQARRCFDHLVRKGFRRALVRDALSDFIDDIAG